MKVQSLRTLLWLGNALVILAIAGLLAVIVINFKKHKGDFAPFDVNRLKKEMDTPPSIAVGVDDSGRGQFTKYASIWDLNVTGKEIVTTPTDTTDKPVAPVVPPIAEELGIEMVVTAAESTSRLVELRYKKLEVATAAAPIGPGGRGVQPVVPTATSPANSAANTGATTPNERLPPKLSDRFLKEGDPLLDPYDKAPYNGKVVQIASDEVVFSWGGKDEALPVPKVPDITIPPKKLPGVPGAPGYEETAAGDEPAADTPPEFDPKETRKIDDNTWFIGSVEKVKIQAEYEKLYSEVEWTLSRHREDQRQYLKAVKVPEGSLAQQRGIEEGDLLRTINSRAVYNKTSIFQYFQENPSLRAYRVEVERRGQRKTLVFQVAD